MRSWHVRNSRACWLRRIIRRKLSGKIGERGHGGECGRGEVLYGANVGIFSLFYRKRVNGADDRELLGKKIG
jgi:hypothetical protein